MYFKNFFILGLFGLFVSCSSNEEKSAEQKSNTPLPNIVLVLVDDMGYSDLGCWGSNIKTPVLDSIAKESWRFTQFYNMGRCCPSRASLLTGRYPHEVGVGHMSDDLSFASYRGAISPTSPTLAEVLKEAGYSTYMTGKWHVGSKTFEQLPLQRGFDKFYGSPTSPAHYFRLADGRVLLSGNDTITPPEDWFSTKAFTDSAISYIQDHLQTYQEKPFFLYLAYNAPHWPLHAPEEDIELFKGKYDEGWAHHRAFRYANMRFTRMLDTSVQLPLADEEARAWELIEDKELEAKKMEVYSAMVYRMDKELGRLIQFLKAEGKWDNTVFMFLSDNGASAEVVPARSFVDPTAPIGSANSYATTGLEWATVSNIPFRKYKSRVHEGGISTPFIFKPVNGTKGISDQVASIMDILPTLKELAGLTTEKKSYEQGGQSLLPFLDPQYKTDRELYWEHEGHAAVRQGDWKLVKKAKAEWELYDMKKDRSETKNLIKDYPEKAKKMEADWQEWARKQGVLPFDTIQVAMQKAKSKN